jgi:hypothetical protein
VDLEFSGELYFWRGPAPHYFVAIPADLCPRLADVSPEVTYGWGMIPVAVQLGRSAWTTSLFPKDGGYLVPIKKKIRLDEGVDEGDEVTLRVAVDDGPNNDA